MSNFKDAVQKDVKAVFINMDEFADIHVLNGVETLCVVDTDITSATNENDNNNVVGVFLNACKIYVAESDIETRPVEGELLDLDGETYIVRKVSRESGILEITAEANLQ